MATKKTNSLKYKSIQHYLDLPWTYTIEQAKDKKNKKIYIVRVNELPGVSTDGHDIEQAMTNIQEAMSLAFELYMQSGEEIPIPIDEKQYKGNIAYRTSPRRHYDIAQQAYKNKLSLSSVIDTLIDNALSSQRKK